jgi:hypothetical protein
MFDEIFDLGTALHNHQSGVPGYDASMGSPALVPARLWTPALSTFPLA